MENFAEIRLARYRLPKVLRCGPLQIKTPANGMLDRITFGYSSGSEANTSWFGTEPSRGAGQPLVYICTYRLPEGMEAFRDMIEWFGDGRKKWVRLPEGVKFEPTMLAPRMPASWKHEAFATSARSIVHVYTGPTRGVLLRLLGPKGAMLKCRLFEHVLKHMKAVESDWHEKMPECTQRRVKAKATDRALGADVATEVSESIQRAYAYLKLDPKRTSPAAAQQAIYEAVNRIMRAKKRPGQEALKSMAIDLGCLWGQCLCDSAHWEWRQVKYHGEAARYAITSPDRALVVAPMSFLLRKLSERGPNADNTTLLLYNMIMEAGVPDAFPREYQMLG